MPILRACVPPFCAHFVMSAKSIEATRKRLGANTLRKLEDDLHSMQSQRRVEGTRWTTGRRWLIITRKLINFMIKIRLQDLCWLWLLCFAFLIVSISLIYWWKFKCQSFCLVFSEKYCGVSKALAERCSSAYLQLVSI